MSNGIYFGINGRVTILTIGDDDPGPRLLMEINSLRPWQNGRYNADDIFKCIFLKGNAWIPTKMSLKFVPKGPINTIPALVQIMAWRRRGDKPLSEPMMVSLLTLICVTLPQWLNWYYSMDPDKLSILCETVSIFVIIHAYHNFNVI